MALLSIKVGRFGSDPVSVQVPANSTVGKVLEKAEIDLNDVERVFLNGETATKTKKVKRGDIVSVVSPKEAGRK